MARGKVGLYLGVDSLAGVVVEKKKVVSLAKFDLSTLEEEAKVENLNEEVKWEALINKTLRDLKADASDVYVALADRDFIFRAFEMPLMRKREIESSLSYEVEKYIPFKLEQLRWDFSYTTFPREKKISVSFIGIREGNFQRSQELLTRLNLNPVVMEPSSLSLVRALKSIKNFSRLRDFALLDFTESEAYLTFFYHDLPVFNRYFIIPKKESGVDLEKFLEPVHRSFQYFTREFRAYEMNKFLVVGSHEDEAMISALREELQTDVEVIIPAEFTGDPEATVETLKAIGVAGINDFPYKFKPSFLTRAEERLGEGRVLKEVPLKTALITFLAAVGLIGSIFLAVFLGNKVSSERFQLRKFKDGIPVPSFMAGLSWEQKEVIINKKEEEVIALKKVADSVAPISPFLRDIPAILPSGTWLDEMSMSCKGGRYKGSVRGYIFLGDSFKERAEIDRFISSLRRTSASHDTFSQVRMISSERQVKEKFELTSFSIRLD